MKEINQRLDQLHRCLDDCSPAAIALSGGVDSMTLAYIAHRHLGTAVTIFHAVSAAVPTAATERVRRYERSEGWALTILDAGEFADERYMVNPANRCFFCKSNLYQSLAKATGDQLLSGTNLDDLGDWRPGLQAAKAQEVRHPFVETGIDKAGIRRLAAHFGLTDLAELPAAPCLSSRIETGLRIDPSLLPMIDRIETLLRERLRPETVRCRMRKTGVVIELDEITLNGVELSERQRLEQEIQQCLADQSPMPISFALYRRGSAFLRKQT